jgi:hypothetical protein
MYVADLKYRLVFLLTLAVPLPVSSYGFQDCGRYRRYSSTHQRNFIAFC